MKNKTGHADIITKSEFEKLVAEGVAQIPRRLRTKLDNVEIVIANRPTAGQARELKLTRRDLLLGLYEGVPQSERNYYYSALPDKITIFQEPITKLAQGDPEKIKELVSDTVYHEIGHHFGIDEEEMERVQAKRRQLGK